MGVNACMQLPTPGMHDWPNERSKGVISSIPFFDCHNPFLTVMTHSEVRKKKDATILVVRVKNVLLRNRPGVRVAGLGCVLRKVENSKKVCASATAHQLFYYPYI